VVAFLLGRFLRAPITLAGVIRDGAAPSRNGDLNGDGTIDISDGVYILSWLFKGGPAPRPIVCPSSWLPATGQAKCYDEAENEVPYDSIECPGQDGFYQAGCPSQGRFVDNGDGAVTDNCTGLMWQQMTADVDGDGHLTKQDGLPWCNALAYCENLSYAGHDDWRLPNARELGSIVDYGRWWQAIDPVFQAFSETYWTSTPYVFWSGFAWRVDFSDGNLCVASADSWTYRVRAVRTIQPGE